VEQSWYAVGLFLAVLICAPFLIKWLKLGQGMRGETARNQSKLISALAVGPQQKVVTVEVGPEGARTWLVLGITVQQVTCLHVIQPPPAALPGVTIEK
jgi:flagellar protein FliO/FliZ